MRIRFLQRELAMNLRRQQYSWEKPCPFSAESWKELQWRTKNIQLSNGLPIKIDTDIREPDISVYVDASDTGWGITSNETETHGLGPEVESDTLINAREPEIVLFAHQLHARKFRKWLIHVYTDNMTALKHTKKSWGSGQSYKGCNDNPNVEQSILVTNGHTPDDRQANANQITQDLVGDRMAIIRTHQAKNGISDSLFDF